jgi:hypothetical protein
MLSGTCTNQSLKEEAQKRGSAFCTDIEIRIFLMMMMMMMMMI